MHDNDEGGNGGRVVMGLVIVAIGVIMLLDRTGLADISLHVSGRFWPFIVIALGLARMFDTPRRERGGRPYRSGGWLLWVGTWGLVSEFHVLGLDYGSSWPLLIIGVGLSMIWRTTRERDDAVQGS